jgi:hypothetical protein
MPCTNRNVPVELMLEQAMNGITQPQPTLFPLFQRSSAHMHSHRRMEKRLPMVFAIYLVSANEPGAAAERVLTGDVSPRGARVSTKRHWQPGKEHRIVPLSGGIHLRARVVYCLPRANRSFCVGLDFVEGSNDSWRDVIEGNAGITGINRLPFHLQGSPNGVLARLFTRGAPRSANQNLSPGGRDGKALTRVASLLPQAATFKGCVQWLGFGAGSSASRAFRMLRTSFISIVEP